MKAIFRTLGGLAVTQIIVICLPVALVSVGIVLLLNPTIGVDELSATVTVPLMVSYLMVRIIDRAVGDTAPPSGTELRCTLERDDRDQSAVPEVLAVTLTAAVWVCVTTGISLGIYRILGLIWAFNTSLLVLKAAFCLIALISVAVCLKWLFRIWLIRTASFLRLLFHFQILRQHRSHAH